MSLQDLSHLSLGTKRYSDGLSLTVDGLIVSMKPLFKSVSPNDIVGSRTGVTHQGGRQWKRPFAGARRSNSKISLDYGRSKPGTPDTHRQADLVGRKPGPLARITLTLGVAYLF